MRIRTLLFFSLLSFTAFTQCDFVITAGVYANSVAPHKKDFALAVEAGKDVYCDPIPSMAIGVSLDTIKWGKARIRQTFLIGGEYTGYSFRLEEKTALTHLYDGYYDEAYLYLRYTPKILLGKRFYVAPMFNISYRINDDYGDAENLKALQVFGIVDPHTEENYIKPLRLRVGPEIGMSLLKNKLEIGFQSSYDLNRYFHTYYKRNINYFNKCWGAFLTYSI